ncbi:MAG: NADH-quinone oxidoreductase subunit M [Bradymonadales bacterium]|nr:MAG: NADH-quinone oxidoreductase subunit M [Bradymonadales bacterium]
MADSIFLLGLCLIPALSSVITALAPVRGIGKISTVLSGVLFVWALSHWGGADRYFSFPWFEALGLRYSLHLDSYSYLLILLSSLLGLLCSFYASWAVKDKAKAYHSLFHALQASIIACLLAEDLLFFYVFFEAMLIPMFFLIGIWGGKNRLYATMKFFLYTFAGSLFMLIGLLSLYVIYYQQTGEWTASFPVLRDYFSQFPIAFSTEKWIFLSFVLAFAIKVPLFPFHTWLPDAHTEAPTAGSVILAGILLKIGTYGLMRFALPLFPESAMAFATPLCVLSVLGIVVGAIVAWRQVDMKRLIAYSSVSHLGFVTLGIFSMTEIGWNGAYLQMLSHGITTGALFFLVGFIYDQRHSREIEAYGGLAHKAPIFVVFFVVSSLSSVGLPGLNGFVGEFLILLGSFQSVLVDPFWVVVATTGVILSAIYTLHLIQKICYGEVKREAVGVVDFGRREWLLYSPLVLLMFSIGLYPSWVMDSIYETTSLIFSMMPEAVR